MRDCTNCSKYKTKRCPQGNLCYYVKSKPQWESMMVGKRAKAVYADEFVGEVIKE